MKNTSWRVVKVFFFFFEIIYFAKKEGFWRLGREKSVQQIGIEEIFLKISKDDAPAISQL